MGPLSDPPSPLVILLFTSLVTVALAAAGVSAKTYPVNTDGLHCRSGPGTSYAVKKTYAKGHQLTLSCYKRGTSVSGDTLWYKTSDGCYASDYYISTGTSNPVVGACATSGGGGGGGTSGGCANINDAGVALIKRFEGYMKNPYKDPVGKWTVGYGHLCANGGKDSSCSGTGFSYPLTEATATALLKKDLPTYVNCLRNNLSSKASLNKNQWAALTSWVYNLGCGNFQSSSLRTRLNNGENPITVISQEFPKWVHAGGKVLPGLVTRRNAEIALAKQSGSTSAWPRCA